MLSTKERVTVKSCALFKKRNKQQILKKKKIFNPRVVYTSDKQKLWNAVLICFKEALKMYFIMLNTKNLDVLGGRILKKLKHQWGLMFPADIIFLFHSSVVWQSLNAYNTKP